MARPSKATYSKIFTQDMIEYYQGHIIEFVEDIIFQNNPDYYLSEHQREFLLAIQNSDRVAAKSGKGCGKTSGVSFAIIWFMTCFSDAKVVCTAPTSPTLYTALWPELSLWLNRSVVKDLFIKTTKKMYMKQCSDVWFCEPRTAKDADSAQGAHAPNMLIIMDEASGVKEEIFEAYDGTLTSQNNKFVLIGNPVRVSGPFYDAFNKFRHRWKTLTFNAEDSPFVKEEHLAHYVEKYGKHHDLYLSHIQGEFPSGSPDSFLKLDEVHDAVERYDSVQPRGEIEIGIDVARFGDDLTVLYWRHGYKVYQPKILAKNSIPEAVQLVLDTVKEIRIKTGYDKRIKVKVDDTGVGGGCTDYLKLDREHNIEVVPCNNGGKGNDIYQNEISIMWGHLKENLKYIGLPDDPNLVEELAARRWRLSNSGKIMIEPKSEFKKEYKASPDRADALMLCFASKVNEDTIIKDFDPLDSCLVSNNVSYIGEDKFASVFYSKDLTTSVVYTAWDGHRLYVYDEFIGKDSLIHIATNLHYHMPLTKIIGNESMFSLNGEDLANKFRKFGVSIRENYSFNELAAIETLSNMVTQRRIILSSRCESTIHQLSNWKINKNRFDLESTYGICYALCNIISELKRKIEFKPQTLITSPYTGEKSDILRNINNRKSDIDNWMLG